jgi:hypothetical protein
MHSINIHVVEIRHQMSVAVQNGQTTNETESRKQHPLQILLFDSSVSILTIAGRKRSRTYKTNVY